MNFFFAVRCPLRIMPLSNALTGGSAYLTGFFSIYKADAILKELRTLVESKDDISVSIANLLRLASMLSEGR